MRRRTLAAEIRNSGFAIVRSLPAQRSQTTDDPNPNSCGPPSASQCARQFPCVPGWKIAERRPALPATSEGDHSQNTKPDQPRGGLGDGGAKDFDFANLHTVHQLCVAHRRKRQALAAVSRRIYEQLRTRERVATRIGPKTGVASADQ